jgi:pyruvoyl-dependent arginine decarboxylase (PvlArgDC)
MNEQLAEIYGTNQYVDEEDLVKEASAELLVKLAEEEGVDLNDFSDEEVAGMLSELEGSVQEEDVDDYSEKVAEADYMGRIMAHAMVDELGEIDSNDMEKEARFEKAPAITRAGRAVKRFFKNTPERYRTSGRAMKRAWTGKRGIVKERPWTRAKEVGFAAKKVAPEAGVLGAAGGGAYAYHKMKKKSSAIGSMAEERAYEILADNGWVSEDGEVIDPNYGYEKTASALELAVEEEAMAMLAEAGYPVQ